MPETHPQPPRFCSQCGRPIVVEGARFCKECGATLEGTEGIRHGGGLCTLVAFGLSFIPGLGHVYQGHPWRGIAWFFGVTMSYRLGPPLGVILHLVCAANAALYDRIHPGTVARRGSARRRASSMLRS